MTAFWRIAAFAIAAIVSGIVAMEVQTKWTNPDLPFWQAHGMAWLGGIAVSALVLTIAAMFMHLFGTGNSIVANVLFAAVANVVLLLLLALIDRDRLLLDLSETFFALLWGASAGLLWYLLKLWLPCRIGA